MWKQIRYFLPPANSAIDNLCDQSSSDERGRCTTEGDGDSLNNYKDSELERLVSWRQLTNREYLSTSMVARHGSIASVMY